MSDYVEASYALVVLAEARGAERNIAHKLVTDFLHDSATADDLGNAERREAISAICTLRDLLKQGHMPHDQTWEIAFKAVSRRGPVLHFPVHHAAVCEQASKTWKPKRVKIRSRDTP